MLPLDRPVRRQRGEIEQLGCAAAEDRPAGGPPPCEDANVLGLVSNDRANAHPTSLLAWVKSPTRATNEFNRCIAYGKVGVVFQGQDRIRVKLVVFPHAIITHT